MYENINHWGFIDHQRKGWGLGKEKIDGLRTSLGANEIYFS